MTLFSITAIILISALSESLGVYSSKPRVRTLLSARQTFTLFVRKDDQGSQPLAVDVPSSGSYQIDQLYELLITAHHIAQSDELMFSHRALDPLETTPLSNIGISAESHLTLRQNYLLPFLKLFANSALFHGKYPSRQIDRSKPYSQFDLCTTFGITFCECDDSSELITKVILNNVDVMIDLRPLVAFTQLKNIMLEDGQFRDIDWTPFTSSGFMELTIVYIHNIDIRSLDLSPLSGCKSLKWLHIEKNKKLQNIVLPKLDGNALVTVSISMNPKLKSINLEPLSECNGLRYLRLNSNQLESLIFPQSPQWHKLKNFDVDGNPLQTLNLQSISKCSDLHEVEYSPATQIYLPPELQKRIKRQDAGYMEFNK